MKKVWVLLLALLFLSGCFEQSTLIPVEIVRIVDGDTLIVEFNNGVEERVRLLLVDTPESVHPNKPVEPLGIEASEFAKESMPPGETVYLEMDKDERDRYDRLLAYVWIDDVLFNEELIENGFARVAYVYPPNTRHVDRFYDAEDRAKQKKAGIWNIEGYVTDEGFNPDIVEETMVNDTEESAASCDNPEIKGNHSSSGEYIYHLPGGQYYERTTPVDLFCTELEAIEAGYRKSMR